jgi:aryl-alcohol dehydrogenase-like predicted oxidoreductase
MGLFPLSYIFQIRQLLIVKFNRDRHTPIEETVRAFNHIINIGKAFYWGTSEWNADEIATAWRYADKLGLIGPVMEQPCYNMLTREKVEKEFEHLYEEVGLGLTIFSPLKIGILTGKYNDGIPDNSRLGSGSNNPFVKMMNEKFGDDDWKKEIEKVVKLKPVADKLQVSQAVLAMAWVLKNKNVSSAITGASRPEQIYDSVKALTAVEKLTPEIMAEIDEILGNKPAVMTRRY